MVSRLYPEEAFSRDGSLEDDSNERGLIKPLLIVKFDTDTLPPILNALETQNGGQKLVLEVAVS